MKILYVCAGYLPKNIGGVELHVHHIARELKRQGQEVLVFARDYSPGKEEFAMERTLVDQVPVVKMNYKFSDCDTFEKIYTNPSITRVFREVFQEFKPDLVHVHHLSCLSTDIVRLVKESGTPVVMTIHDFWMGCPRGQRVKASLANCPEIQLKRCLPCLRELWPSFFRGNRQNVAPAEADSADLGMLEDYHATIHRILESCDRLITPSKFMKEIYVRYEIPATSITVVENGLDHDLFKKVTPIRSTMNRFGFIGSVLPSKGVHILIDAFKRIAGSDESLHIWGEVLPFHKDTNYGHRLAVLTKGWESSIQFHGRYENKDVPGILAGLDVVVVPSIWYEAFCLTIREGFLAGVPVIASNFGAMAEAIEDGETGLLFNVGDSVDLSEKMKLLLDQPALRRKLAAAPKKVATVAENVAGLKRIYREVSGCSID
ncbi:MAG: glycosyltransferase family 4 protein [Planctomycetes bacterium]|nr:glycosyltransferase family 4 protein [Planctomycetota bacterium]